jgi:membrane-associated HD superfamily phosphohydrolase
LTQASSKSAEAETFVFKNENVLYTADGLPTKSEVLQSFNEKRMQDYLEESRKISRNNSKIKRDYRTVLAKIVGIPPKNSPQNPPLEHSQAVQKTIKRETPKKLFPDDDIYSFNAFGSHPRQIDVTERVVANGSVTKNLAPQRNSYTTQSTDDAIVQYDRTSVDDDPARTRIHKNTEVQKHKNEYHIYQNKLRMFQFILIGALMLLETLIVYLILVQGMGLKGDIAVYYIAIGISVAVILTGIALYIYDQKKVRSFSPSSQILITRVLITLILVVLIILINILIEKTLFLSNAYLSRIVLPLVISLNILLADIAFVLLHKTNRFSVQG